MPSASPTARSTRRSVRGAKGHRGAARGDQAFGFGDGVLATRWINAGKGEHDVGIFRRKCRDLVVRNRRTPGQPFINGENDAADFAFAVIGGEFVAIAGDRTPAHGGRAVRVPFLGAPARFPVGP